MSAPPFSISLRVDNSTDYTVKKIISGKEELSALFCYEVLIQLAQADHSSTARGMLGKQARLSITAKLGTATTNTTIHTVLGTIFSVEATTAYDEQTSTANPHSYLLCIRPSFAKACYSRNRRVYQAAEGADFLAEMATRWGISILPTNDAIESMPTFAQLVQNDESDYNFFTRVLASWGLGYVCTVSEDLTQEVLVVYNAVTGDGMEFPSSDSDSAIKTHVDYLGKDKEAAVCLAAAAEKSRHWRLNYGIFNQNTVEQQYNSKQPENRIDYSLHREPWISTQAKTEQSAATIHQQMHNNREHARGMVMINSQSESTAHSDCTRPGCKVRWGADADYGTGAPAYLVTRREISATASEWKATIEGRATGADTTGACYGLLPRPVRLNDSPDLCSEELITGEAWPEPRPRYFLAKVVNTDYYKGEEGRNIVRVCEVPDEVTVTQESGGTTKTETAHSNTMWVEMCSPYADANSGLLARPRVGNVLLCIDRGDLSIPMAVSAVFRDSNDMPLAKLKQMDRQTRADTPALTDPGAVTLRNRLHVPERTYTKGIKGDKTTAETAAAVDKSISNDHTLAPTRPMSVKDLAESPLPFSQIQLVSHDNGVKPIPQGEDITSAYMNSSIGETIAGIVAEADMSLGYAVTTAAKTEQGIRNKAITRPHFEGISMYSGKDMLIQSSDHQLINAGGEIVLTAAQAITLRVGKSSIKITEGGITISSTMGKAERAGAYPAYHPADKAENVKLIDMLGGKITVDGSGVQNNGPYVSNLALNQFKASTRFGSMFKLTDWSAKLNAPCVTVIGGAALVDMVTSTITTSLVLGKDGQTHDLGTAGAYNGPLVDGWKAGGSAFRSFTGSITMAFGQWSGYTMSIGSKLAAQIMSVIKDGVKGIDLGPFDIRGSYLNLDNTKTELYSKNIDLYAKSIEEHAAPIAQYKAAFSRGAVAVIANSIVTWGLTLTDIGVTGTTSAPSPVADSFTMEEAQYTDNTSNVMGIDTSGGAYFLGASLGVITGLVALGVNLPLSIWINKKEKNSFTGVSSYSLKDTAISLLATDIALTAAEEKLTRNETAIAETRATVAAHGNTLTTHQRLINRNTQAINNRLTVISNTEKGISSRESKVDENGMGVIKQNKNVVTTLV